MESVLVLHGELYKTLAMQTRQRLILELPELRHTLIVLIEPVPSEAHGDTVVLSLVNLLRQRLQ